MDPGSTTQLCPSCESLSLEDLVSPAGVTTVLQPRLCRLCDLISQALESCECEEEWECRAELSGQPEILRRKSRQSKGFWFISSNSDSELKMRQKRRTLSLKRKAKMKGEVEAKSLDIELGLDLRDIDTIKLWARPIDHARSMMAALKAGHSIEMGFKLEGITVCYGRADVMQKITENWPSSVMSLEIARDPVRNTLRNALTELAPTTKKDVVHVCAGGLNFMADSESYAMTMLQYMEPTGRTDSDANYTLAQGWLQNCHENHDSCRRSPIAKANLPSRLIDVEGDGDKTRLKHVDSSMEDSAGTNAEAFNYLALSYCWGAPESSGSVSSYQTSIENLDERKAGFSELSLPKTIRDAVSITRRLGVKYLWVDAICILQGKDNRAQADWKTESARMHHVYGEALLTIAVASGSSVQDGIFNTRRDPQSACRVSTTLTAVPGLGDVNVTADSLKPSDCQDEPLYHRGWTLQERVLSTRVLIYTRDQLMWECQGAAYNQSGTPMESLISMRVPKDTPINELQDRWQVLVTDYSARDLSRPEDKLPALAGLAQAFLEQMPDNSYLAGLWMRTLLDDILWAHRSVKFGRLAEQRRPSEYRAPSWSWAAVDGNIRFLWAKKNRDGFYHSQLLKAFTSSTGLGQFGEVTGGELILQGPFCRLQPISIQTDKWVQSDPPKMRFRLYLDALPILPAGKVTSKLDNIFFLRIKDDIGLLLTPVDNTVNDDTNMVFSRMGVATFYNFLQFDEVPKFCWEKRKIRII